MRYIKILFLISLFSNSAYEYGRKSINESAKIKELEKEIERLKPYENSFKTLADKCDTMHKKCFTIGN